MRRMIDRGGMRRALCVLTVVMVARQAGAIYLDEDQNISFRSRVYSQVSLRTEGSYDNTTPSVAVGQVVQHRNFFNPELEAKLTPYTTWMKSQPGLLPLIAPDAFDFRLAAWGFYDGIYDYGTQQFDRQRSITKARWTQATSVNEVLRGTDETINSREVYATQHRVNELYLSYTKGPLFIRFGKQAISWGESDTIAILDQNNPFDLTLGAPGIFEDLDEARIPLWTLRTSYSLFDTLGPLSSGFVEAYWVPGSIDTTTATVPLSTLSPYSPPGPDPALQVGAGLAAISANPPNYQQCGNPNRGANPLCVVLVDHVPSQTTSNSRWGVRAQTVVARDYTVSAWIYTTFPNGPIPRLIGRSTSATLPAGQNQLFLIEFVHDLTPVFGLSNTFFFEPLDGIIRMEAEYFNHEPAFIPTQNLPQNPAQIGVSQCILRPGKTQDCVPQGGSVPRADYLRWELGFDRFFFFRPLNPTNSFTWVTAFVGSYNMSSTGQKDYRYEGQQKPGTYPVLQPDGSYTNAAPKSTDFVDQQMVDMFFQTHLQTDYLHGRLSPAGTVIVNTLGTFAIPLQLTYRWSDSLIFDAFYTTVGGAFSGLGFFRDRDQVSFRATVQLN